MFSVNDVTNRLNMQEWESTGMSWPAQFFLDKHHLLSEPEGLLLQSEMYIISSTNEIMIRHGCLETLFP